MTVDLATKNPAKRQAATVVASQSRSASPSSDKPLTNGDHLDAASPADSSTTDVQPRNSEISTRTIALLNVPDTVNDARIRAMAEPYGPLVKVVLRPDHQGAIIEYREVFDAGKAAMGLDGYEIMPGRHLGVGTVGDMKRQKEEKKHDRGKREPHKHTEVPKIMPSGVPIKRPAQPGQGRRGGLGVKRGGPSLKESRHTTDGADKAVEDNAGLESNRRGPADAKEEGPKSNADFKAMFLGR